MTTYFSSGFETGDFSEWDYRLFSPYPTIDSAVKYAGSYSSKSDVDMWYDAGVEKVVAGLPSIFYIHGRVRIDAISYNYSKVVMQASGYVPIVAGDYGKQVRDDGLEIGVLKQASNSTRTWWIASSTPVVNGSLMTITGGTGSGTSSSWTDIDDFLGMILGQSAGTGNSPWYDYSGAWLMTRKISGVFKFIFFDNTDEGFPTYIDTGIEVSLGVWYDIDIKITKASYPNGEAKLYINNSLVATLSSLNTDWTGLFAGFGSTIGGTGYGAITMWVDEISVNESSQLNPIGYSGGKIIIGANSLESPDVLDISMDQSCDVALRDVPLKSLGEVMDTGTYVIHTLTLTFSMRLSSSDKTTLETIFTSHAEATIYLEDENANYWTFTGWFRDKDVIYEYEKTRPWKATFIFDIYSYSYSGASIGTFTNSQLRLVGGATLDYEDIIDFSVGEETSIAIPNWVNQSPTIDTNVWNKKLKRIIYTVRETEYRLYQLLQMLTAATAITFYDYIHGPTNKTAWLTSIRAGWNPIKKENNNSFIDAPWEVEFEVIVQN